MTGKVYGIKVFDLDDAGKARAEWYCKADAIGIRLYDKLGSARQVCSSLRSVGIDARIYELDCSELILLGEEIEP